MPGTLRGQFQLWWTFWLNVSNRRLTGQLKIVWMKGQIPPGGMDVSFFMPSLSPLTFDALASRSRIWASSLKGLSLYSVCSQSLNCTNTEYRLFFITRRTAWVIYFHLLAPHLICLGVLKLLELVLEAHVGGGAGSGNLHCCECVAPAQPRHCHDVGDH